VPDLVRTGGGGDTAGEEGRVRPLRDWSNERGWDSAHQPWISLIGMALAAAGYLPPAAGAVIQGVIDVLAAGNALRVALPPRGLTGYQGDCRQPGVGNNCTPGGPAPPTPVG